MDIYFKTIAGVMVAVILCLVLNRQGSGFGILLSLLVCCLVTGLAVQFLVPIVDFFHSLESWIPLDNGLLEILLKVVSIGILGEIAGMICNDSGNAALGKTLQLLTTVLILWLSLPLLQSLLDLVKGILEAL